MEQRETQAAEPDARAAIARRALAEQSEVGSEGASEQTGDSPAPALAPPLFESYTIEDAREDTTAIAAALYRVPLIFSLPKNPQKATATADGSAQRAGRRLGGRAARAIPNWLGLLAAAADGAVAWMDELIATRCEERDRKASEKGAQ